MGGCKSCFEYISSSFEVLKGGNKTNINVVMNNDDSDCDSNNNNNDNLLTPKNIYTKKKHKLNLKKNNLTSIEKSKIYIDKKIFNYLN
jgi:hypothetical protein